LKSRLRQNRPAQGERAGFRLIFDRGFARRGTATAKDKAGQECYGPTVYGLNPLWLLGAAAVVVIVIAIVKSHRRGH
jgi:hypothetical protein